MLRPHFACFVLIGISTVALDSHVSADDSLQQRVDDAIAVFEGAEQRFQLPDPTWFEATRAALFEETQRLGPELESHGSEYAAAWKNHLRWPLLVRNLGDASEVNVEELALVRRWLFSNREGLEYPFFAELRERTEAHLDAAYTFAQPDLQSAFRQRVEIVRQQLAALATDPTDANVAALGRTLGWFEQTRQLADETAATRSLLSFPNAQIVVSKPLIDRAVGVLATEVEQTLPVTDRVTVPNGSLLGRPRTAHVRGTATTHGFLALDLADNDELADVRLVYDGDIDSSCRAVIGPVTVAMRTIGPVQAITPVHVSLQGVQVITTDVVPQVRTRITGVSADRELIRRIGKRRAFEPESMASMNSRATFKAASLLRTEMEQRVTTVIDEIRAEIARASGSFGSFQDVLAPVVREGATPRWVGIESTSDDVIINAVAQRREQFGAVTRCPSTETPDVQVRMHVSLFNNMGETIMAGKTFTDKYFMRYGKILQAELPPQLMVHARSLRWAVVAQKPRPLEITIPEPNVFRIELRMQRVDIGEDQFTGPTIATVRYLLTKNEYDEYGLERQGEVELDSPMPADKQAFLQQKLSAFFAPLLDGGGVALPEGGSLGRLRGLKSQGVTAERDWLTLGVHIPTEVLADLLPTGDM